MPFVPFIALMQSVVEFDNVGLRYGAGVETLTDISFTLYPGSFHFLTGASGAGKTSLLKLLYLAHRPSRGAMRMFGHDTITLPRDRLPGFRRRIGVVFQDFRLVPHLSTFDNIALPLRIAGVQEKDLRGPVTEMLAWIGLTERADARPATLSGGEQQRVAIARALVNNPSILLADEPTGNLDSKTSVEVMELFGKIHSSGNTVILVTHEEDIAKYAHRVVRLRDGNIETDTLNVGHK